MKHVLKYILSWSSVILVPTLGIISYSYLHISVDDPKVMQEAFFKAAKKNKNTKVSKKVKMIATHYSQN